MRKEFSNWYSTVSLNTSDDALKERWALVEDYVKESTLDEGLQLILIAFHYKHSDETIYNNLIEKITHAIPSFDFKNQTELQILAISMIAELIEEDYEHSLPLALGVLSVFFDGKRKKILIPDLHRIAEEYIHSHVQKLHTFENKKIESLKDMSALKAALKNAQTVATIEGQLTLFIDKVEESFNEMLKIQKLVSEESNIFWWFNNKQSRDFDKLFSSIDPKSIPLIIGKELSDLVLIPPGPLSYLDILKKVLESMPSPSVVEPVTLLTSVSSLEKSWFDELFKGSKFLERHSYGSFFPLLSYLWDYYENEGESPDEKWDHFVLGRLAIKENETLNSLSLAKQMYIEKILLRFIEDKE